MRGEVPWDEDPALKDPSKDRDIKTSNKDGDAMEVVVCSFMPVSGSTVATLRPCPEGYRLHCSDNRFQLYDRHIGNTFVYVNRPPAEHSADVATSIALQKISRTVQTVGLRTLQISLFSLYNALATWPGKQSARPHTRTSCSFQSRSGSPPAI